MDQIQNAAVERQVVTVYGQPTVPGGLFMELNQAEFLVAGYTSTCRVFPTLTAIDFIVTELVEEETRFVDNTFLYLINQVNHNVWRYYVNQT
ncbi:hypothetical protein SPFM9_00042 [Salmonella phage SPFM9]|nr:hypothetical protein SPFM9_00042 [Salmonella phage SPFM9]